MLQPNILRFATRALRSPCRAAAKPSIAPGIGRLLSFGRYLNMPPKSSAQGAKRKPTGSASPEPKRHKANSGATDVEKYGIVDRRFYPAEMANSRCIQYNDNKLPRPIAQLRATLEETKAAREKISVGDAVVHWFKVDLRIRDNHALHAASETAKSNGASLICVYLISPQDFEAHITAPVRVDFMLRSLEVVRKDLAALDIPLYIETVEKRAKVSVRLLELCKEWKANHLFANAEYEVDELRRETGLVKSGVEKGIAVDVLSDTCVVSPGELETGSGKQYAVYSPFFRSWIARIHKEPEHIKPFDAPTKNPGKVKTAYKSLFECKIPDAPKNKQLSAEEKKRFEGLWPAGEHEAERRLNKFLTNSIGRYKDHRNFPWENATAMLSAHFAAGTLSARSAVAMARDANSSKKLDGGNAGIVTWISEVAWRDFYKHVLAQWPFICMNKCFKPEYTNIEWEYNDEHLQAWKDGRTGYPIVDAAMRQLKHMGYMHNRCRMVVASFLSKDLMLDWRMGEQYFMSQLVDGDFASNHGGWGFSSSTGVDPQPYFRIFNPLLQSEKFDAQGDYIRKWVPELKELDGKAIHAPYDRGAGKIAAKNNYPKPIVEHKFARERCLKRYKEGLGRDTS